MTLPSGFIEMARTLLGNDADDFLNAITSSPVCSVRINSRKPGAHFDDAIPVKWCKTGFYLPSRPVFTLDPLLHAGAYYVQDASSMIYREVASRILNTLSTSGEPQPVCILDMCAAPGGKTTAMIDALPDGSKVIANEYVAKRAAILRENLAKWGFPDTTVLNKDSSFFKTAGYEFDIIAVDAPCSGEGMMRKDPDAVAQWSPQLIENCARLQKDILANAVQALKPGGFLIYSTCTFNRIENEENAEYICSELNLEPFDLAFPEEWGIPHGISTSLPVYRFMPHKTEGEGLFLAVFRKPGEWIPPHLTRKSASLINRKTVPTKPKKAGSALHKGKTPNEEVPEIEEILSVEFDKNRFPEAPLTKEQALAYLRRESITLPPDIPKGIVITTFNGLPLGAAKNIGSRANNLYPKNWRIRMN
ncbi:MAG: hypothetical protein HDR88_16510 [Bacteroides sp.]|nr:hypothetical protein [Bacteroides sp.]